MAMKLYNDEAVQAIANAIREKTGDTDTFAIGEMAERVQSINTGAEITLASGKLCIA